MRLRRGRFVGAEVSPTTASASGIWTLAEVSEYQAKGEWPALSRSATASLLLHFDTGSSGTTPNDAPNSIEVILETGATISSSQSVFGGYSLSLNGSSGYAVTDYNPLLAFGTGDFTIEFWLRASSTSATQVAYDSRLLEEDGIVVGILSNGSLTANTGSTSSLSQIGSAFSISADQWYHVAVTRSSGAARFYVDGSQQGSDLSDSTNYTADAPAIGVDSTLSSGFFSGYIDELRVIKGAAIYPPSSFTVPASELSATVSYA